MPWPYLGVWVCTQGLKLPLTCVAQLGKVRDLESLAQEPESVSRFATIPGCLLRCEAHVPHSRNLTADSSQNGTTSGLAALHDDQDVALTTSILPRPGRSPSAGLGQLLEEHITRPVAGATRCACTIACLPTSSRQHRPARLHMKPSHRPSRIQLQAQLSSAHLDLNVGHRLSHNMQIKRGVFLSPLQVLLHASVYPVSQPDLRLADVCRTRLPTQGTAAQLLTSSSCTISSSSSRRKLLEPSLPQPPSPSTAQPVNLCSRQTHSPCPCRPPLRTPGTLQLPAAPPPPPRRLSMRLEDPGDGFMPPLAFGAPGPGSDGVQLPEASGHPAAASSWLPHAGPDLDPMACREVLTAQHRHMYTANIHAGHLLCQATHLLGLTGLNTLV